VDKKAPYSAPFWAMNFLGNQGELKPRIPLTDQSHPSPSDSITQAAISGALVLRVNATICHQMARLTVTAEGR
jgi:hypothetical protein